MAATSKKRLLKVLTWASLVLGIGLAYSCLVKMLGRGLGCPIHWATGFYCAGCGVSRMCLALLRLDFKGAFLANRLLFVSLPVILGLLCVRSVRYVRTGKTDTPKWENICWIALAAAFTVYAVARNLPWFSYLAPM